MTEQELIQLLRIGDSRGFRELFALHKDRVFRVALSFLPNQEDAEDVTQEVFVEVFRSVENFREGARLSTWLHRITVNKCLELIRKRKRKKRFAFLQSLLPGEGPDVADSQVANHPGLNLENQERAQVLQAALDKLPENQRIAFSLSQIEGMKYEEIAVTMAVSKSSVESLIFRGRKNLRKYLEDFYKKD